MVLMKCHYFENDVSICSFAIRKRTVWYINWLIAGSQTIIISFSPIMHLLSMHEWYYGTIYHSTCSHRPHFVPILISLFWSHPSGYVQSCYLAFFLNHEELDICSCISTFPAATMYKKNHKKKTMYKKCKFSSKYIGKLPKGR